MLPSCSRHGAWWHFCVRWRESGTEGVLAAPPQWRSCPCPPSPTPRLRLRLHCLHRHLGLHAGLLPQPCTQVGRREAQGKWLGDKRQLVASELWLGSTACFAAMLVAAAARRAGHEGTVQQAGQLQGGTCTCRNVWAAHCDLYGASWIVEDVSSGAAQLQQKGGGVKAWGGEGAHARRPARVAGRWQRQVAASRAAPAHGRTKPQTLPA